MPILTLIAARTHTSLDDALLRRVAETLRSASCTVLSDGEAAEFVCSTEPDPAQVRALIGARAIDFVLASDHAVRRKLLLVADMDSTIVEGETLDALASWAGIGDQVAALTARAMNGELDFEQALRTRVALLEGLPLAALEATWRKTRLTAGAVTLVRTMRAHGAFTALVSGGFSFFTARVAQACGFDLHRANDLLDDGAALTGRVAEPILGRSAKRAILGELAAARAVPLAATLALGDGANDLPMILAAGLGVAFHAKPVVAAAASVQIRWGDLRSVLFAQGYRNEEFV